MRVAQVDLIDGEAQSRFLRLVEGVRDAQVIRLHAQQASHQCTIRAVSPAGFSKRAVEMDLRLADILAEQRAGHRADARSARRT